MKSQTFFNILTLGLLFYAIAHSFGAFTHEGQVQGRVERIASQIDTLSSNDRALVAFSNQIFSGQQKTEARTKAAVNILLDSLSVDDSYFWYRVGAIVSDSTKSALKTAESAPVK